MYSINQLSKTLFLDIETVSAVERYESLDDRWQAAWQKKHKTVYRSEADKIDPKDSYPEKAAIYSELERLSVFPSGI